MARPRMEWDDLRVLLTTVREGNVTRAGDALAMDPTTVTRRLRRLEAQAGTALLERVRGGVLLTAAGESLRRTAEAMEETLAAGARELDAAHHARGVVRVGVQELLAMAWTPDFVAIASDHPGLLIELVEGDDLASLTRREVDIALRVTSKPPAHLVGRRLSPMRVGAYGVTRLAQLPPAELPWIGWSEPGGALPPTEQLRDALGCQGPYALKVRSYGALAEAARRGLGVAALPEAFAATVPELVELAPPLTLDMDLWALTHEDLRGSPRVRAVMDALYERMT